MFTMKYLTIIAALGGFIAGLTTGGFGTKIVYDHIVIPVMNQEVEEEKIEAINSASARCEEQITAATAIAAERAKNAERIRLQIIHDAALEIYRDSLRQSGEELAAARQEQEKRDKQYEFQLAESGRSCPLNLNDIDYLSGVHSQSEN